MITIYFISLLCYTGYCAILLNDQIQERADRIEKRLDAIEGKGKS